MKKDDKYFKQGKLNDIKCKKYVIILMPVNKKDVRLCRDVSCNLGVCYTSYHALVEVTKKIQNLVEFTINNN